MTSVGGGPVSYGPPFPDVRGVTRGTSIGVLTPVSRESFSSPELKFESKRGDFFVLRDVGDMSRVRDCRIGMNFE